MKKLSLAALALVIATPGHAAEPMVSAKEPKGLVAALEAAGYTAKLEADDAGDPMIEFELNDWTARIYFYNCDEKTHTGCDSIQFQAGFDRAKPWNAAEAMQVSTKYRFASIRLDADGDPYVMWDVNTGDGIATKLFLTNVEDFGTSLNSAQEMVFAEERAAEAKKK